MEGRDRADRLAGGCREELDNPDRLGMRLDDLLLFLASLDESGMALFFERLCTLLVGCMYDFLDLAVSLGGFVWFFAGVGFSRTVAPFVGIDR